MRIYAGVLGKDGGWGRERVWGQTSGIGMGALREVLLILVQ